MRESPSWKSLNYTLLQDIKDTSSRELYGAPISVITLKKNISLDPDNFAPDPDPAWIWTNIEKF